MDHKILNANKATIKFFKKKERKKESEIVTFT